MRRSVALLVGLQLSCTNVETAELTTSGIQTDTFTEETDSRGPKNRESFLKDIQANADPIVDAYSDESVDIENGDVELSHDSDSATLEEKTSDKDATELADSSGLDTTSPTDASKADAFEFTSDVGSSTGWLTTKVPITEGESFILTFHIHDEVDGYFDSQVILDNFRFLTDPEEIGDGGTTKIDGTSSGEEGGETTEEEGGEDTEEEGGESSQKGGPNDTISDKPIRVEFTWDTPNDPDQTDEGPEAGADVDLHFMHPLAKSPGSNSIDFDADGEKDGWFDQAFDCFWFSFNPDWGPTNPLNPGEAVNDPTVVQDDTDGMGPEIIELLEPEENTTSSVGVHYWNDHGYGPSYATVRIYIDDALVYEKEDVKMEEYDFWEAATVNVSTMEVLPIGDGAAVIDEYMHPDFFNP